MFVIFKSVSLPFSCRFFFVCFLPWHGWELGFLNCLWIAEELRGGGLKLSHYSIQWSPNGQNFPFLNCQIFLFKHSKIFLFQTVWSSAYWLKMLGESLPSHFKRKSNHFKIPLRISKFNISAGKSTAHTKNTQASVT